jgi:hypothetical protein
MVDDDRIDFSALDPRADRRRWEELVASTTERVIAARRPSLGLQLRAWARPALAVAAAVMVAVWGGSILATRERPADPAMTLLGWAATTAAPSTADILNTLARRR